MFAEYHHRMNARVIPGVFADRRDAGHALAAELKSFAGRPDVVVLALPRGGVPVGYEVAVALGAPLDVFEVRKLGVPGHNEFAMGALGSGGLVHLNKETIRALGIERRQIIAVIDRELRELERREKLYRDGRPRPQIAGKTVILVDDGLATGSTMRVALEALREKKPAAVVVAVPVASAHACRSLHSQADAVVCIEMPEPFYGVGHWYDEFTQVGDKEVRSLLDRVAQRSQR